MKDLAVKFENVYKEYPFYQHLTAGFKSFLFNLPRYIASFKKSRFLVLDGITFEVKRGETYGIIGKNGSGKSTILSLIAGVIMQDRGAVIVNGRVSSLLELGLGFHPDLSGIENITLNGILMGNTRTEILKKLDEIVEFSELGDFIYQPLRTYSSGMHMRLGFSVAVHILPEILLVDEALAVGDISFQEKCIRRMMDFKKAGVTIIVVSHDMSLINRLCDMVFWQDSGEIIEIGDPKNVIERYMLSQGQDVAEAPVDKEDELKDEATEDNIVSEDTLEDEIEKISTWWDYPLIVQNFENNIVGQEEISFYDFLKAYIHEPLEKGLSICNRLKGIEDKFGYFNICSNFDVVKDTDNPELSISLIEGMKKNSYDLVLSIDVLHRLRDLKAFLSNINESIRGGGYIIALEYVGPAEFNLPERQLEIIKAIYRVSHSYFKGTDGDDLDMKLLFSDMNNDVGSSNVIETIEQIFDILTVRYLGGAIYDFVINRILNKIDHGDARDKAMIELLIQFDQILLKEGILDSSYALIIGRKALK